MKVYCTVVCLLFASCQSEQADFAKPAGGDTLSLIPATSTKGMFVRKLKQQDTLLLFHGQYWFDGDDCWVYPWHGMAYDGATFYLSDSGMVNLGIRKNIFGKIKSLYLSEYEEAFQRIPAIR